MAKASPTQAWLWHQRRSHLNFDYINLLSKKDIMIGLPKLKYVKDQLCSYFEVSKAKRSSFKTKVVPSSTGRLNLLHMDLCSPMRVESINGKKSILVIVDDYSRYTWTLFLRTKDETPEVPKDFLKMIQHNLQAQVIKLHNDRGTEFLNKTLTAYFKEERTRLIVESIHIKFDEIKEMTEMSIDNNTSCLVSQRQKASDYDNSGPVTQLQQVSPLADTTAPSQLELDLHFGLLYDEFFTNGTSSVNKSSSHSENSQKQYTRPTTNIHPITEPITPTTTVHAEENYNNQAAYAHFKLYEFVNPLCTPVQEVVESSLRNQESLVTESTTLEANVSTKGTALEASLVNKGISLNDNTGVTKNSRTKSERSSIETTKTTETPFNSSEDENRSYDKEISSSEGYDAIADIGPFYDSDTVSEVPHDMFKNVFSQGIQSHKQPESSPDTYEVNENNSNIFSDIPNMDQDRDKEGHDDVAYDQL
nr:retrovirus-related Pol polyprotein from transposon TNT 1-94 [Tanacetum cinerariifolium]